ncbi:MAG: NUDIX hydrolase [Isosphaeraceae bacterium]
MTGPSWSIEGTGEILVQNWLLQLRRQRFRSKASCRSHDYFVIDLADAVSVIAITPDQEILLVRVFRAGSGRDSLETPGGLVEPGEDPATAAARELLEETGYSGRPGTVLMTAWSNPSLTTSRTTTVLIEDARPVAPTRMDPGEELELVLKPAHSVPSMIDDGTIDNALVLVGLLRWMASMAGTGS